VGNRKKRKGKAEVGKNAGTAKKKPEMGQSATKQNGQPKPMDSAGKRTHRRDLKRHKTVRRQLGVTKKGGVIAGKEHIWNGRQNGQVNPLQKRREGNWKNNGHRYGCSERGGLGV